LSLSVEVCGVSRFQKVVSVSESDTYIVVYRLCIRQVATDTNI
jgi:hypothetical protein